MRIFLVMVRLGMILAVGLMAWIYLTIFIFCINENAETKDRGIYPLDVPVRVYPEEIRYGDPCFLTFSVTNQE